MDEKLNPPPVLKDRYRLVKWLGEGSMGVIYLAHDEMLGRDVAIKFLSPERFDNQEASDRYILEARTVARLSHTNIMTIHDVGQENDWHYLVLEYIPGENLEEILAERDGPLPIPNAINIIQGVLAALNYAHKQGVIHRDIKPQNIMVTSEDRVCVTDFGLALSQGEARLTQEGALVGTILYLAPELISGGSANEQTDLYAAGVVFYELVIGNAPFADEESIATVLSRIVHTSVDPPRSLASHIPADIEQVILTLLAKKPQDRYASVADVLTDLATLDIMEKQPEEIKSDKESFDREPLTLLERIVRISSSNQKIPNEETLLAFLEDESFSTSPEITQSLLVYAAQEDTAIAVEAERYRLAQLLERDVLEPLNLLLSQTSVYEQSLNADPATQMAVSVVSTLARQIRQQVLDLGANLHPTILESLGLEPALDALINQERRTHGLVITLSLERLEQRLPPQIELTLFRVIQDALDHASRKARASRVDINLVYQDGQMKLTLAHNGSIPSEIHTLPAARQRIEQLGGIFEVGFNSEGIYELQINFEITPTAQLTPREMEVIQKTAEGLSNKEIALFLSISPRTVNFHLDNIYSKLGVSSRTEAAVYALRQGWVQKSSP